MFKLMEGHLLIVFGGVLVVAGFLYYLNRQFAFRRRCPACDEEDLERMNRQGWLKKVSFIKLYRCRNCMHLFIRPR